MPKNKEPKFHLITYGCQMNKSDSERLTTLLVALGFVLTENKEEADLVVINTCSVRQSAEDRVYGAVRKIAELKEGKPDMLLAVTGCMPGRDRDGALRKKMPAVDFFFPTSSMTQLPRWIAEVRPELVNSPDLIDDYLKLAPDYRSKKQAFVTIQTGCNKFCTYCVVPFSRGLEKNRPLQDILNEIKELVLHGCVEVTLLGQTVNSYVIPDTENVSTDNPYKDNFAQLLWEVNQIPQIKRLHFTAPHPIHMTNEVIDAMTLPAHLNFIHLPVQAGDNEVLKKMNRRYTVEQFVEVVNRLRSKIPNIAIGTDIIVGFCGESVDQFEKTLELYKQVDFDIAYTAQYSARSGTAAWRAFKDDVPREEKKRRWEELQILMEETVLRRNQAFKDQIVEVLVDRHEPPKFTDEMLSMPETIQEKLAQMPGACFGNSREMKLVSFPGDKEMIGKIVKIKITKPEMWILEGELVEE